jgi:hypothetical protein
VVRFRSGAGECAAARSIQNDCGGRSATCSIDTGAAGGKDHGA